MLSDSQSFRNNNIEILKRMEIQGKFDGIEEVLKKANDLIHEILPVEIRKRKNIDNIKSSLAKECRLRKWEKFSFIY